MKNKKIEDPRKYLRVCKGCQKNVYMIPSDVVCEDCQKVDHKKLAGDMFDKVADQYNETGAKPDIKYPPNFKPDCNVHFDGKAGKAKLTLPALGEIMRQLAAQQGPPPRVFTMPIELKKIDAPLTNVIWISPDIAAAMEEHMTEQKKKKEIKLAAE